MMKIIGWKVEDEKIILKTIDTTDESNAERTIELPNDIYCELLKSGPPTEDKMIRDLILQIQEIRKKRILTVDAVDKELEKLAKEEQKARGKLESAETKLEVEKWSAILRSIAGERANQGQRRHLVKLLHQEEGALQRKLLEKV